jgi:hypothetical protein
MAGGEPRASSRTYLIYCTFFKLSAFGSYRYVVRARYGYEYEVVEERRGHTVVLLIYRARCGCGAVS